MISLSNPIAFGSVSGVNKYKQSNGIKIEPAENKSKRPATITTSSAYNIGGTDDGSEVVVLDSELELLNNILIRNDPEVVYMQEDFSFYDDGYLSDVKIDDGLLAEVRKIRRIYRNYEKYMYACYIREKYLSYIEQEYSMDTILQYTNYNTVIVPKDVFIPPYPIYSKNADDYDEVMSGNYMPKMDFEPPSDEELMEVIDKIAEYMGRDPEEIDCVPGGIETFRPALEMYDDDIIHSSKYSGPSSVSVTDLDALQKLIRSWHEKEETKVEQRRERIPFPKSEEGIRRQYYSEMAYYITDYINAGEQEEDENEMVYDEVIKKPMTRKEYRRRKALRMLSENCGWDMVKLMSQLNVGSKMERRILRNKAKNKKKARKKAENFMNDIMGMNDDYNDAPTAMSEEELRNYLFGD